MSKKCTFWRHVIVDGERVLGMDMTPYMEVARGDYIKVFSPEMHRLLLQYDKLGQKRPQCDCGQVAEIACGMDNLTHPSDYILTLFFCCKNKYDDDAEYIDADWTMCDCVVCEKRMKCRNAG